MGNECCQDEKKLEQRRELNENGTPVLQQPIYNDIPNSTNDVSQYIKDSEFYNKKPISPDNQAQESIQLNNRQHNLQKESQRSNHSIYNVTTPEFGQNTFRHPIEKQNLQYQSTNMRLYPFKDLVTNYTYAYGSQLDYSNDKSPYRYTEINAEDQLDEYQQLILDAKRQCKLEFNDPQFPPNENSLSSKSGYFHNIRLWVRIDKCQGEQVTNRNKATAIFPENGHFDPCDLLALKINDVSNQNQLVQRLEVANNLYFVNALIQLCSRPSLIYRLFEIWKVHQYGLYCIWICKDGAFNQYIIDDKIPVIQNKYKKQFINLLNIDDLDVDDEEEKHNYLQYVDSSRTSSARNQIMNNSISPAFSNLQSGYIWLILLEKAYAKAYGNYEHIWQHGTPQQTIRDLTGAPSEDYIFNIPAQIEQKVQLKAEIWDFLLHNLELNYIVFATFTKSEEEQYDTNIQDQGKWRTLLQSLSYPIIDIAEQENKQYIKILELLPSFYENEEGIKQDQKNQQQQNQLGKINSNLNREGIQQMTLRNAEDNWIEIDQFIKRFNTISVNKVHEEYYYSYKHLKIPTYQVTSPNNKALCFAVQLNIKLNNNSNKKKLYMQGQSVHSFISLVQKDQKNYFNNKVYTYSFIRLMLCEGQIVTESIQTQISSGKSKNSARSNDQHKPILQFNSFKLNKYSGSAFSQQREVLIEQSLVAGSYVLYIEIEQTCKLSNEYVLSCYSANKIEIQEIYSIPFDTSQLQEYQFNNKNIPIQISPKKQAPLNDSDILNQKNQHQRLLQSYLGSPQGQLLGLVDQMILNKLISDPNFYYYTSEDITKNEFEINEKVGYFVKSQSKENIITQSQKGSVESSTRKKNQDEQIQSETPLNSFHRIQIYKEDDGLLRCSGQAAGYIYFVYMNFSNDSIFQEFVRLEKAENIDIFLPFEHCSEDCTQFQVKIASQQSLELLNTKVSNQIQPSYFYNQKVAIVKFRVRADLQGYYSYEVSFPWVDIIMTDDRLIANVQQQPCTKKQRAYPDTQEPIDVWESSYFYSGGCVLYYENKSQSLVYCERLQLSLRNLVGDGFNAEEEIIMTIQPMQSYLIKLKRVLPEEPIQYAYKYIFSLAPIQTGRIQQINSNSKRNTKDQLILFEQDYEEDANQQQ